MAGTSSGVVPYVPVIRQRGIKLELDTAMKNHLLWCRRYLDDARDADNKDDWNHALNRFDEFYQRSDKELTALHDIYIQTWDQLAEARALRAQINQLTAPVVRPPPQVMPPSPPPPPVMSPPPTPVMPPPPPPVIPLPPPPPVMPPPPPPVMPPPPIVIPPPPIPPVIHQGGGDDLGDNDNLAENGIGGVGAGADMAQPVLEHVAPLNAPNPGLPIQGPEFLIRLHNLISSANQVINWTPHGTFFIPNVRVFQEFLPTAPWLGNWANFRASLIARGFIRFETMMNTAEYCHKYFIKRYFFRVKVDYHPNVRHGNPRILLEGGDQFDRITGPEFRIEVGDLPTSIRLLFP